MKGDAAIRRLMPWAPLLLVLAAGSAHAVAFVKTIGTGIATSAGTSISITVPAAGVASGNSIIVAASIDSGAGAVSCSDTQGNSYSVDLDSDIGSSHIVICAAHNVTALASGNTITLNHPSVATRALSVLEFSGISAGTPLDKTASASGTGTAPSSGATATTAHEKELIIGVIGTNGPSTDSFTAGTFYSASGRRGTTTGPPNQTVVQLFRVVNVTGTYAATATITSANWTAAVATYAIDATGFELADDFETGTVLDSEVPPGKWDTLFSYIPGNTLEASTSAAHRGTYGLLSNDTTSTASSNTFLGNTGPQVTTGNHYYRFWFQLHTASAYTGNISIATIYDPFLPHLAELYMSSTASNRTGINGKINGGSFFGAGTGMSLSVGTWYLIEIGLTGVGTASGNRKFWVNGVLQHNSPVLDWSAQQLYRIQLGNIWSANGDYQGEYYFDDVRSDSVPHASQLAVTINPGTHNIGQCNPVTVSLLDSFSAPTAAPYAFNADLAVSGVTGSYYSNDTCSSSTSAAAFSGGASSVQAYFKASTAGTATLTASYLDFVDGSTTMSVSTPTAVSLASFTARPTSSGVALDWETEAEFQTLGFRLYREANGHKQLLTREPIGGSGFLVGADTRMWGRSYSWLDSEWRRSAKDVSYWLEALDLDGTSTWHGPALPPGKAERFTEEPIALSEQDASLSHPAEEMPTASTRQRRADIARPTAESLASQWHILSSPSLKIQVKEEGWYHLDAAQLAEHGFGTASTDLLQLHVDGREVPISVTPSGSVEFFGLGLSSPHSASRAYWLTVGLSPGKRIDMAPSIQPSGTAGYSLQAVQYGERALYFAALDNGETENFFGPLVQVDAPLTLNLPVKQLAADATTLGQIELRLQGVTPVDHRLGASLNGAPLGEFQFFGRGQGIFDIAVPLSALREGNNTFQVFALNGALDKSLVDSVTLTFPQKPSAGAGVERWVVPAGLAINLSGLDGSPLAYDVTEFDLPRQLSFSGNSLVPPGEGERYIQGVSSRTARAVTSVASRAPTAWHALEDIQFVILAHPDFIPALAPLVERRRAQGWSVAVVNVEEVYDEFSFGNPSPSAIRDFLCHLRRASPLLSHVLLVGDASVDSKNVLGKSQRDFLPTHHQWLGLLETASDDWFADFDGDGVPELAVGRFPVRTLPQVATVVQKTLDFETAAADEAWRKKGLLVVGRSQGAEFESSQLKVRAAADAFTLNVLDAAHASGTELQQALDDNYFLVNYLGHGSAKTWQQMLSAADVPTFFDSRPSLLVAMTCLNGFFSDLSDDSLAELLLTQPTGGAAAVWASSALSYPEAQAPANAEFVRSLGDKNLSLGQVAQRAKAATPDSVVRNSWLLFGDPTLFGSPPAQPRTASGCGGCHTASDASFTGFFALLLLAERRRRR
jgi:hypothetical protein